LRVELVVNGQKITADTWAGETLLELLRRLGLKSVKKGCETGNCGACTILLDGRPVLSCIMLSAQADGRSITTVEGLCREGRLHPVQEEFVKAGAPQCGFCTPGMILTAVAFLAGNPDPVRDEVREAISGNICRCSGYVKVVDAIMSAAERLSREGFTHG
jgi:carbon-monoxide dehydrogenase small subunit